MFKARKGFSAVMIVVAAGLAVSIAMVLLSPVCAGSDATQLEKVININTATKEELMQLKRIGPSLAGRLHYD